LRIAAPSPDSIAELYAGHHGWLHGWLRKNLGCHDRAADLAHDTFVRLLGQRQPPAAGELRGEPRALLTHIAKGLIIDHWRRREVERAYLEAIAHLPEAASPSPESRYLILETLCRIERMLHDMPARTREIFLLSQLEALTYAQIAEQLDLSLITVKRHMKAGFIACMTAL
jgi:RNA polymerase sigma factor (sigma-70 family)